MNYLSFSPKDPLDEITVSLGFSKRLTATETVAQCVFTCILLP